MAIVSDDYVHILTMLLPRGRAWEGRRLKALVEAIAASLAECHHGGHMVASAGPPDQLGIMTDDWLRVLGVERVTFPARYVASRLHAAGGQSATHYRKLIKRLSTSEIEFTEFRPMTVGRGCGMRLYGPKWRFVIEVTNIESEEVAFVRTILSGVQPAHVQFLFRDSEGNDA